MRLHFPLLVSFALLFLMVISSSGFAQKSAQSRSKTPEAWYQMGRDAYYDGDYKETIHLVYNAIAGYREKRDTVHSAFAKCFHRIGDAYRELREHRKALKWYAKAEDHYRSTTNMDSTIFADILMDRARVYSQMYEPQRAIDAYNSAHAIFVQAFGDLSNPVANTNMNVGIDLIKAGKYQQAEGRLLKAKSIFEQTSDSLSINFNRVYSNLGYLYRKMGDYLRALDYGKKALRIKLHNYSSDHPSVGKYYANIGDVLMALDRPKEALPYYEKNLENQLKSRGINHPQTAGSYADIAWVMAELGEFEKAIRLEKQSNTILSKKYPVYHPYRVAGNSNLGLWYEKKGEFSAAMNAYRTSIHQILIGPEPQPNVLANIYAQKGDAYLNQKQYPLALQAVDSAIMIATHRKDGGHLLDQVGISQDLQDLWISGVQDKLSAIAFLDLRSKIFQKLYDEQSDQINFGERGLQTLELVSVLVAHLRTQFPSPQSRAQLRKEASAIYQRGIQLAARLYDKTGRIEYLLRGLQLSNASKAGLFLDHLHRDQVWRWAGLTEEQKRKWSVLHEQARGSDEKAAIKFYDYEQQLRQENERYAYFSGQVQDLSIPDIQMGLAYDDLFIDYTWCDSQLVVFCLSSETIYAFNVPITSAFLQHIGNIQNLNWQNQERVEEFMTSAHNLYLELLSPAIDFFPKKKNLILCLDEQLHHLSFASIIIRPASASQDTEWLIFEYGLRHVSSPSLLIQKNQAALNWTQDWIGFAPSFKGNGNGSSSRNVLAPLHYNKQEIQNLSAHKNGRVFIEKDATKSNFIKYGKKSRIIHLATHATLNNEQPLQSGLHFSQNEADNFLSAQELYNQKLSAELAVLSACQTGAGNLLSGEGVLSLERALRFAGVHSVIATKWLADDRSMYIILEYFYDALSKGYTKSQALRFAQLEYLKSSDPLQKHPYFWAGLVISGDDVPVYSSINALLSSAWIRVIPVLLILMVVGIIFWFHRRHGSNQK